MPIIQMDPLLINQIAAGEVVTRPASAVKELIENALDALPSEIKIDIQNAGLQLIKIQDNGSGISKQDLPLTIAAHATSKITTLKQLSEVNSFGFRGEALASIASVAEVSISSKTADCEDAWCLQSKPDSAPATLSPVAHPQGTTVAVKNLFSTIPVRRRFLASDRAEFTRILAVVQQFILQHQHISFILTHNKRNIISVPVNQDDSTLGQRFIPILGEEFNQQALSFCVRSAGMILSGYIARPQVSSAGQGHQFSYVNQRYVRDKLIIKAMKSAYADLQFQDRQPKYIVHLELEPTQVDVNVHPSKHEVRFRQSKLVYEFIYSNIKSILDEATSVDSIQKSQLQFDIEQQTKKINNELNTEIKTKQEHKPFLSSTTKNNSSPNKPMFVAASYSVHEDCCSDDAFNARGASDLQTASSLKLKDDGAFNASERLPLYSASGENKRKIKQPWQEANLKPACENLATDSLGYALGQLHDTFIVAQTTAGMILVDMHAAHERVIYEKMKIQFDSGDIVSQRLLLSVDIALSLAEQESLLMIEDSLRQTGWEFTLDAQTKKLKLTAAPVLLANIDFEPWIRELLDESNSQIIKQKHQRRVYDLLGNMACRAAIKTNRHLTITEMNSLLRQIEKTPYSSYCNHGRPTWRLFTLNELDRFFVRGQ